MRRSFVLSIVLSLASVAASAGFIGTGASMVYGENLPSWMAGIGLILMLYGGGSIVLVIVAWLRGGTRIEQVAKYLAVGIFVVFVLGSLDAGIISGHEWFVLVTVAILLGINWLAVKTVANAGRRQ
jgi:hypothetical protein